MISNKFFSSLIVLSLIPAISFADKLCTNTNEVWNGTRCVTAGASAGAAAISSIFAMKKYSQANSIAQQYSMRIFDGGNTDMTTNRELVSRAASNVREGDRVTITYQLSEAENRAHHIELMESNARTANANVAHYGVQAVTATHTIYETISAGVDSDGNQITTTISRSEPDLSARAMYASMAITEAQKANDFSQKASEARNGGVVPTYNLEKVIDGEPNTAKFSAHFTENHLARGGKVLTIERLPAEKLALVKNAAKFAKAGVVGAVLGAGVAVEEVIAGRIANKINARDTKPSGRIEIKAYGAQ